MTSTQKIIKYLAIAFAVFLIVNIFSGIFYGIYILADTLDFKTETKNQENIVNNYSPINLKSLSINVKYSNITIKSGASFKVETNNKYIKTNQDNNKLSIEEDHHLFNSHKNNNLTIYIPKDIVFDKVNIETGAGTAKIDKITTTELYFDIGAGKTLINELNVSSKARIDGGAGKIDILSGTVNNLNLDMGVGKTSLTLELLGNNKIDAGIGKLDLKLLGLKDNYQIKTSKGIGSIKVDNTEMQDDEIYGSGTNYLDIDGGIGSINVSFN